MQIAYDVQPEDLVALCKVHLARSPAVRRQTTTLRLACAGLALIGVTAVGVLAGGGHLGVWMAGGAAGALVGFFCFPRWFLGATLHRARQRYEGARGRALCGRHHLSLEETGLRAHSEAEEHLAPWNEVLEVMRTPDRIFLFVGSERAHVIPVSGVVGGDLEVFLQKAEARMGGRGPDAVREAP